jgi:hypothetical protein
MVAVAVVSVTGRSKPLDVIFWDSLLSEANWRRRQRGSDTLAQDMLGTGPKSLDSCSRAVGASNHEPGLSATILGLE